MVLAGEVGGRWSEETATFLRLLAAARARSESALLRRRAEQAWRMRWGGMLACAAARAFAASLLEQRSNVGGDTTDLLRSVRVPPRWFGLEAEFRFCDEFSLLSRQKKRTSQTEAHQVVGDTVGKHSICPSWEKRWQRSAGCGRLSQPSWTCSARKFRANHTVRTLPPSVSQERAEAHDEGGGPRPAGTVKSFDGDQACLPCVRRDHQNHKQANLVRGHMAGSIG